MFVLAASQNVPRIILGTSDENLELGNHFDSLTIISSRDA
jgi:hypothetical protein